MSIETSNLPGLKEEHELLRSQVRRFVEREVIPMRRRGSTMAIRPAR